MPKLSDAVKAERDAIKENMRKIKDEGLLPKGYGNIVKEMVNNNLKPGQKAVTISTINQVAGGYYYNEAVVDALLQLAKENKIANQLALSKEILS